MSKELEYIQRHIDIVKQQIKGCKIKFTVTDAVTKHQYDYYERELQTLESIEQALQRLESIDNAKPSEALECLEKLKGMEISSMPFSDEYGTQEVDLNDIRKVGSQLNTDFREYTTTIKQALIKAEKEHKSLDLLMQELDCKDFADLRKYARCGYQTFRNAKGANYDNIIIDEAVIPSEAIVEKSLKALEILKRNVKVSIDYGEEGKDISMALVFYIDNKKTIYVVDEAIKEQNPEHFKELELLKEALE